MPSRPLKLSEEKIEEISASHTVFGYDFTNRFKSEALENYEQKKIDPEVFKNKKDQVNELRKHFYKFGDNKNNY